MCYTQRLIVVRSTSRLTPGAGTALWIAVAVALVTVLPGWLDAMSTASAADRVTAPPRKSAMIPASREAASIYDVACQATVELFVDDCLVGSGWFADSEGLVITAAHCVRGGSRLEIRSVAADRVPATLVAVDAGTDLALLRVDDDGISHPNLSLADVAPRPGEEVFVLGAPDGIAGTMMRGMIARDEPVVCEFRAHVEMYVEVILIAGLSRGGMSGGPWLNSSGEVVGVVVGGAEGLSHMSPATAVAALLKSRRSARTPTIGARMQELWLNNRELLQRFPPRTEGVLITGLQEGGPAAQAGLSVCEVIVEADGTRVRRLSDLLHVVRAREPDEIISVKVVMPDGAGEREVRVSLGRLEVHWIEAILKGA